MRMEKKEKSSYTKRITSYARHIFLFVPKTSTANLVICFLFYFCACRSPFVSFIFIRTCLSWFVCRFLTRLPFYRVYRRASFIRRRYLYGLNVLSFSVIFSVILPPFFSSNIPFKEHRREFLSTSRENGRNERLVE